MEEYVIKKNKSYELIDCGDCRRLEKFGSIIVDRAAPMAQWEKTLSREKWNSADVSFDLEKKKWFGGVLPENWVVDFEGIVFRLEAASNGQVGVFPEQQDNWKWITKTIENSRRDICVLNCFAHTGGSTLSSLRGGASVTHVDAAKSANARAKKNAVLSGYEDASVRWITEDALKFMHREFKRGNRYDAIILDPPAFGRMGKKIWKFEKNMPELLEVAQGLYSNDPLFFLLTSHPTGWSPVDLKKFVKRVAPNLLNRKAVANEMKVVGQGNSLPLGISLRVEYND